MSSASTRDKLIRIQIKSKMTADIKRIRRGKQRIDPVDRGLEIFLFFLPNDQPSRTARFCHTRSSGHRLSAVALTRTFLTPIAKASPGRLEAVCVRKMKAARKARSPLHRAVQWLAQSEQFRFCKSPTISTSMQPCFALRANRLSNNEHGRSKRDLREATVLGKAATSPGN